MFMEPKLCAKVQVIEKVALEPRASFKVNGNKGGSLNPHQLKAISEGHKEYGLSRRKKLTLILNMRIVHKTKRLVYT